MIIILEKANITGIRQGKSKTGIEYASFTVTDAISTLNISANGWDMAKFPVLEPVKFTADVLFYMNGFNLGAKLNPEVAPVLERILSK